MKSSIYEIVGCIGSQKYREIERFATKKEASAAAKARNSERAGMKGQTLRQFMLDLNPEGKFVADKSGYNGWKL